MEETENRECGNDVSTAQAVFYFMSDCKVKVGGGGLVARVANTRFSSQCKEKLKRALHTGRRCVPR